MLNPTGEVDASWPAPEAIQAAAISDTGSAVAVLSQRGTLWWLDGELSEPAKHGVVRKPSALAIDPHGQYALVSSLARNSFVLDGFGNLVAEFETSRPLVLTRFLIAEPYWIGAADHGLLGCYTLEGDPLWEDRLWSSAGALAAPASGQMILVACFGHGIQRYARNGDNEGAYQLPGPVAKVVCTADGSHIVAATLENRITFMNHSGRVLWDAATDEPVMGLAFDALGRYLIAGLSSGEVVRWDLVSEEEIGSDSEESPADDVASPPAPIGRRRKRDSVLRDPDWTVEAVRRADDAKATAVSILDAPLRAALFTPDRRLRVYAPPATVDRAASAPAGPVHVSDALHGRGRLLRGTPGCTVAATEEQVLVYDAETNASRLLSTRLVEISHLELASDRAASIAASFATAPDRYLVEFPPVPGGDDFALAVIEGRDRLNLVHPDGEIAWRRRLESRVQELAVAAEDALGITTDDGAMMVFNKQGELRGLRRSRPAEAMALALQMTGGGTFQFITTAHESQLVRAYDHDAQELWAKSLPFKPWRLIAAGTHCVILSDDGATVAVDEHGRCSPGPGSVPLDAHFFEIDPQDASDDGEDKTIPVAYLFVAPSNLTCAHWNGDVQWRHVASAPIGPLARSYAGTAVLLGKDLAWFVARHVVIGGLN